ncbi:hypothetical protein IPJ63_03385 [Candidatus Nomurabacteria bacterium]|nr:MAG: hypothetical protein IPJ63_03385 [Candidatus Nomurabacteria bacterium]
MKKYLIPTFAFLLFSGFVAYATVKTQSVLDTVEPEQEIAQVEKAFDVSDTLAISDVFEDPKPIAENIPVVSVVTQAPAQSTETISDPVPTEYVYSYEDGHDQDEDYGGDDEEDEGDDD